MTGLKTGVQARVRSDESGEIVCVSGEKESQIEVQGLLEIKSAGLFREYWNLPDKTDEEFTADGWFKTGDQVRFDGENFHILGRASVDIIKSGGYKISALEIERVMLEHEDIKEIACFAIPGLSNFSFSDLKFYRRNLWRKNRSGDCPAEEN